MPETKKLLVAFDPSHPENPSSDFLIPWSINGTATLYGLQSGKPSTHGLIVFVGRSLTENDLFAKLVDSGTHVEGADETLHRLRQYIENLKSLSIGNIVSIDGSFELRLVAKTPSALSK